MAHHFFALISRMRHIGRWGLMRSVEQENIQEHSHMVAVLAHGLAMIRREVFRQDCDPEHIAVLALYHDAPEILTGDLPTPVKYFNPEIRQAYRLVEHSATETLLDMLPEPLRSGYAPLLREADDPDWALVKAADKLSAHIKCLEELKAGNEEFRRAAAQTYAALEEHPLPELQYFIQHFLPGFSLSLDELQD